jgi:hypothetical protein
MDSHEIHAISQFPIWSHTFMCIGIHGAKHKCVRQSLIFIGRPETKFVPMSFEVNVSLHYAGKRHDRAYYLSVAP